MHEYLTSSLRAKWMPGETYRGATPYQCAWPDRAAQDGSLCRCGECHYTPRHDNILTTPPAPPNVGRWRPASKKHGSSRAAATPKTRFYRGVFEKGLTPPAALQAAQIELLATRRWQHPFYWAGFVLQGEWK
jgi:hypothetical protein